MLNILTEIANITSEITLQNSQIANMIAYFGDNFDQNRTKHDIQLQKSPSSPIIRIPYRNKILERTKKKNEKMSRSVQLKSSGKKMKVSRPKSLNRQKVDNRHQVCKNSKKSCSVCVQKQKREKEHGMKKDKGKKQKQKQSKEKRTVMLQTLRSEEVERLNYLSCSYQMHERAKLQLTKKKGRNNLKINSK